MFIEKDEKITHYFKYDANKPFIEKLPSGVYHAFIDGRGTINFEAMPIQTDGLVQLNGGIANEILNEINFFFSDEVIERFSKRNIMHRRGILLHGPPGTGKSCVIYQLIKILIDKNVVVLYDPHPYELKDIVDAIREQDEGRHILVIWEEFDDKIENFENSILQLMDGGKSVNNIIFITTTNYLEKIPSRIRNRPSRIARLFEVSFPSADERREFISNKMLPEDLETQQLEEWVSLTEGMVIDQIKELITSVCCLYVPLEEAVFRIKEINYLDKAFEEGVIDEIQCEDEFLRVTETHKF